MSKLTAAAGLLALCVICVPTAGQAQDLQQGLWSGSVTPPGAEPVPVTFIVRQVDGALSIVMTNPELGPMEFTDEALDGDELTFWWNAGVRVDCMLLRQDDGSFEGPCADDRAPAEGEGTLTMTPPAG